MPAFQTTFFWIFLAFYLLSEFVHVGLDVLNHTHTKKQKTLPEFFNNVFDQTTFEKSQKYTLAKQRFGLFQHFFSIPFFWVLIFLYGFFFLDVLAQIGSIAIEHYLHWHSDLNRSVLFCLLVMFYFSFVGFPFQIYRTFVLEEKFGFNKTTLKIFIVDRIKGLFLSLFLSVPLLYLVFWFMATSGDSWWLWVWVSLMTFQFLMTALFPTFIAPLFNKFTPLADGELKTKIESLAQKINFKMSGIYTIDGSKRSGHSNAYFAGLGKMRRIVLFDTLIEQLTTDELVAVLAHEMGHNVKNHILKGIILSALMSFIGLFVLSLLVSWPDFYQAFQINPSSHAALIIFSVCSGVFLFPITPFMNWFSRKNEYEADAFAAQVTNDPKSMQNSLLKLTKENLSQMAPHRWYSFFHYSHPTTKERIEALQK